MSSKVAINGFGRIGRNVLRQFMRDSASHKFQIVAVNDLTDTTTLAHLFEYDSVHGRFQGEVSTSNSTLSINGQEIQITAERDPASLPWGDLGVDVVLECTGIFTENEKAQAHLRAGAKKVLISAPSPDPDVTIAYGVNTEAYQPDQHNILSCASCTTNCLAPVAKVLLENFGISRGTMTTVHAFTNDPRFLDLPHKDLRRARAASVSMIPTTTGAAKAVGLVLPALKGKVDGMAMRVPTTDVSVVDFVAELEQDVTVDSVNKALRDASEHSLQGVLGYTDKPLVSIDFLGSPYSSIVDSLATMVIQNRMVKVLSWYDNEIGFSNRMLDVVDLLSSSLS